MRLQGLVAGQISGRVDVVNAGIPGRTSADSLVNIALRVLPIDPDVVIVLHGVNDQKPNRAPGFRDDYSHWYERPPSAVGASRAVLPSGRCTLCQLASS